MDDNRPISDIIAHADEMRELLKKLLSTQSGKNGDNE